MNRFRNLIFPLLLIFVLGFTAHGSASPLSTALEGEDSFYILVEDLNDDIKQLGITREWINDRAELKFRVAHLPVISQALRNPYVYLNCSALEVDGLVSYRVTLTFQDFVTINRTGKVTIASTWYNGGGGLVGRNHFSEHFQQKIDDVLDSFILDFLRANPPKTMPPPKPDP